MKKTTLLILFLVINFGGLALGRLFTNNGVTSYWYTALNKAPWTPPGWVFGVAWVLIMLCFSWYLVELFNYKVPKYLWFVYGLQVILNVSWNWIFFSEHYTALGLFVIFFLLLNILYFFLMFKRGRMKYIRALLLPYIIWLCIATSLNMYIVIYN